MASACAGTTDLFVVLDGAIKLCAFDDETAELNEIILTSDVLQLVRIPGHYWHGFKVLGDRRAFLVYFVNRLYDYETPDEERRPWGTIQPYFRHSSMAVLKMSVVGRRGTQCMPALSSKKEQKTLPCRTDNMMKRIYALGSSAAVNSL